MPSTTKNKIICITGAGGSIGRELAKQIITLKPKAIISIDSNHTVSQTLELIAETYPSSDLIFGNGGDRNSLEDIPEADTCKKYKIKTIFNFGGTNKRDSSTRINQELGIEGQE